MPLNPKTFRLHKFIVLSAAALLCCLIAYWMLFYYLNLNEEPVKSDAIVLFVGPSYQKRLKEAHQLMREGYADKLIVPAHRLIFVMAGGDVVKDLNPSRAQIDRTVYPQYYERTHIEALTARQIMEKIGITSAIMVSAPTHMRRIRIISSKVFQPEKFQIRCIGSRYLRQNGFLSAFSLPNLKFAVTEVVKICSFFVYQVV